MKIHITMNLFDLARLMGDDAKVDDARVMRTMVVGTDYRNTGDVPPDEWEQMLELVTRA